jgi:hypothetical protein
VRRVFASLVAMTTGWVVMSVVGGLYVGIGREGDILGWTLWMAFFSSFVVGPAWLVVYLPVYALWPTRSAFWRWEVFVPVGSMIGALVAIGIWTLLGGRAQEAGPYYFLAGVVGAVSAAVGRWLYPWSRHNENERERMRSGRQST